MIKLHGPKDGTFVINADLIKRLDEAADTHIELIDGSSYVARETIDEIVNLTRIDRAMVRALADRFLMSGELPGLDGIGIEASPDGPMLRVFGADDPSESRT